MTETHVQNGNGTANGNTNGNGTANVFHCEENEPYMDKLMRWNAKHHADRVLLLYPNAQGEYHVNLTGADMERVTAWAAHQYASTIAQTFPGSTVPAAEPTDPSFSAIQSKVIAIVSLSTLASHISWVAVQRLGYTPLILSPRLAADGYVHLLRATGCRTILAGSGASLDMAYTVQQRFLPDAVQVMTMLSDDELVQKGLKDPPIDLPVPTTLPSAINHTGGTTGLPKPVTTNIYTWQNIPFHNNIHFSSTSRTLMTLPIFHVSGLGHFFRAQRAATPLALLSPHRPVTASGILHALDATRATHLTVVPYMLKCLVEHGDAAIDRLASLDVVSSIGSALPDPLGDLLVARGVPLRNLYGQTESGATMRQFGFVLGEWNWLTPLADASEYLEFEKVGDDLYHLVVRAGWRALKLTDRPDGSLGTKDLFRPHPDNLPGNDVRPGLARWKYVARQGDIIVLVNGENADPTPIEQAVMLVPLVDMAIAFGAGHERLGLLVVAAAGSNATKEEVLEAVRPALDKGNALVSDYARIALEDVLVMPAGTQYPYTAKFTLQRPVLSKFFAEQIEAHYRERERVRYVEEEDSGAVKKAWTQDDIREAVRDVVQAELKSRGLVQQQVLGDDDDFFTLGMDSLMSSLVRNRLLHAIPLPADVTMATNVVFEFPSVTLLTQHIQRLRGDKNGTASDAVRDPGAVAQAMVDKYVGLLKAGDQSIAARGQGHVVVLTGATGYIGVQLLHTLLANPTVAKVYCLVRTRNPQDHGNAAARIATALANSQLGVTADHTKLQCLSANLAAPDLGLSPADYASLHAHTTTVIHNAWAVNFNMALASFEPNIASTAYLLNLHPRTFVFISSVAAVSSARNNGSNIQEKLYPWTQASPRNGYGQSKWIAEQICATAAAASIAKTVRILRVGQVSGDTKAGIWNPAEAIPTMVQSARTIGALPQMDDDSQRDTMRWLPSDTTAAAIVDLTLLEPSPAAAAAEPAVDVFHVSSPHTLSWNQVVLPALRATGELKFRVLPASEWVQLLGASDANIETNPPYKLIEHYRNMFGKNSSSNNNKKTEKNGTGDGVVMAQFDLTQSLKHSPALRQAPHVDAGLVTRYLRFWLRCWADKTNKT